MLASGALMADTLRISLRYRGTDVDGGTMPIDDVVDALQGFSGAYSSIAARISPDVTHQLRVTGIDTHSFDLFIVAAMFLSQHANQIETMSTIYNVSKKVFSIIADVIRLKKHTKNGKFDIRFEGDNNTLLIINAEGSELAVPPQAFEAFKDKLIDASLNKVAEPLDGERVKAVELSAGDKPEESIAIGSEEREYFRHESVTTTLTRDAEIQGVLISLNKERNRGSFRLKNNRLVPYRYVGTEPDRFHADFGRDGLVVVQASAEPDDNLEPLRLEIKSVRPIQPKLPLTANGGQSG
jgi:hypothetical protein